METDNFIRSFTVKGTRYMSAVRPSQYKKDRRTPQYIIQVWKMDGAGSGSLYQPALKDWRLPTIQGYSIRTMNLNVEYSRFVEDFKEHEKLRLGLPIPKSARY